MKPVLKISESRKIFGATLIVSVMTGVAALAFFVRELLVASWFGTSDPLEAFIMALLVPMFVTDVVRGSIGAAVVPAVLQAKALHGADFVRELLSRITTMTLLVLIGLLLLLAAAGPTLLRLIAGGFAPAKVAMTQSLFYWLIPLIVMTGLSALWAAVLNTGGSFALPALTPALMPIGAMAALIVWGTSAGIWALAAGTLGGAACETILLGTAVKRQGANLLSSRISMDGFTRQFIRQWSLSAVSVLLILAILIIDQSMAAMIGPGNVAALSYGWKVVGTLWGLGPSALGTVILTYMSRHAAREDHKQLVRILKINALIALIVTIPLATALVMWTEPLTRLLFQRGAFSSQDTVAVAGVQAMYALGLPFMALYTLGARLLSSVLLNRVLAISSATALILKVLLNYLLIADMGVQGIALATSLVYIFQTVVVFVAIWWAVLH